MTARTPRTRYTVGRDAAMLTRMVRIVSDRTLDRILASALRRHYPTGSGDVAAQDGVNVTEGL